MKNASALLAFSLCAPLIAQAGVNIENGNFFITYSDLELESGGHKLALTRTYNSLSPELGWFGYGWGTPYETRLVAMPDGSVTIQQNGTGRITYYRPKEGIDIRRGVEMIVEAAIARDKLPPESAQALRASLLQNEELRTQQARRYGVPAELPANAVVRSNECEEATVTRMADLYKRTTCNGDTDDFDLKGRLLRHRMRDGYSYSVNYEGERPLSITDSLGQRLSMAWTPTGRLAEATNGKNKVTYSYDERANLTGSNVVDGLRYDYQYDGNHNLTRIGYIDNSSMQITYLSESSGKAKQIVDRNGDLSLYDYRTDPQDSQRTITRVTRQSADGAPQTHDYEFRRSTTETGETLLSGIAAGSGTARRENLYDDKGRVVRKVTADGYTDYIYHPRTGKLILMLEPDMRKEFHYDDNGELRHAETSDGRSIELEYDGELIRRMVDINRPAKARRELTFSYNTAGKPVEIRLAGVGKITVVYTPNGEIEKVVSNRGPKMALMVTQAFQDLLYIISVAGVRIDM